MTFTFKNHVFFIAVFFCVSNILSAQLDPQVDIEGSGTLLNIKQDLFTANVVVIRATDSAGGATVNQGSDLLTLRSAPVGFGQFIEMERGTDVVARINTDGSAQFKSIQYPDGTLQSTAAINPIAYAAIKAGGTQLSGTSNISSSWDGGSGSYKIEIVDETYVSAEYTAQVTPNSPDVDKAWTIDDGAGNLIVQLLNDNGGPTQSDFHVIIYK